MTPKERAALRALHVTTPSWTNDQGATYIQRCSCGAVGSCNTVWLLDALDEAQIDRDVARIAAVDCAVMLEERDALIEQLESQVATVRALHVDDHGYCYECSDDTGCLYPCATICALDAVVGD